MASLFAVPATAQTAPAPVIPDPPAVLVPTPAPVQTPDPAQGPTPSDTSSKTCQTTMPMIQAISCALYPANIQSFCQQYQPKLMDMAHCQSAEKYAQGVPPNGQHKAECMKLTFNMGTSSWSFVLACAKTASSQGATGSGQNAIDKVGLTPSDPGTSPDGTTPATDGATSGPPNDPAVAAPAAADSPASPAAPVTAGALPSPGQTVAPASAHGSNPGMTAYDSQCTKKLQSMGAKFSPLGQTYLAGGCVITNTVNYTMRQIPYTQKMDCMLALLMEKYATVLVANGVTKLDPLGSLACRPMNNGRTVSHTPSTHGKGYAADIQGWTVNGTHLIGNDYFTNYSGKGQTLRKLVNDACEVFNGVLAFTYYGGAQGINHIHSQYSQHFCDPPQKAYCSTCRTPRG